MKKKTFKDFVSMAFTWNKENKEFECDLILKHNGEEFKAYSVSVANCELLFYCENATVTYLIDNYFGEAVSVIHEINRD